MITERTWEKRTKRGGKSAAVTRTGWFLFGLIPLFIRDTSVRY